jgi:murein DD-endopeptidase MepM/ murein hydrolase activator NlpD
MRILILVWNRNQNKEFHISLWGLLVGLFATFVVVIFFLCLLLRFSVSARHYLLNRGAHYESQIAPRIDDYEAKLNELQYQLEEAQRRLRDLDILNKINTRNPKSSSTQAPPQSSDESSVVQFGVRLDQTLERSHLFLSRLETVEKYLHSELTQNSIVHLTSPLPGNVAISSQVGYRLDPFTHLPAWHGGVDLPARAGTNILATADGVVKKAQWVDGFGYLVEIEHRNHLVTRYAHAQELFVKQGQYVKTQQVIARVGSTGRSTGSHLHFEILGSKGPTSS